MLKFELIPLSKMSSPLDLAVLQVRDIALAEQQGFVIVETYGTTFIEVLLPADCTRDDLEKNTNVITYQVVRQRP